MVSPRIWTNEDFQDLPDYLSQLSMMYLLTGPDVTSAGCYRVSKRYLEFCLSLQRGGADQVLRGLADTLLIGYDPEVSIVYVRGWFQHCPPTSGKHACGIAKHLLGLRSPLVLECLQDLIAACDVRNRKLPKAFDDTVSQIRDTLTPPGDRVSGNGETLCIPMPYTETETETDRVLGPAPLSSAVPKTDSEVVGCTVDGVQPVDNSGDPDLELPAFLRRDGSNDAEPSTDEVRDAADALGHVATGQHQSEEQEQ